MRKEPGRSFVSSRKHFQDLKAECIHLLFLKPSAVSQSLQDKKDSLGGRVIFEPFDGITDIHASLFVITHFYQRIQNGFVLPVSNGHCAHPRQIQAQFIENGHECFAVIRVIGE